MKFAVEGQGGSLMPVISKSIVSYTCCHYHEKGSDHYMWSALGVSRAKALYGPWISGGSIPATPTEPWSLDTRTSVVFRIFPLLISHNWGVLFATSEGVSEASSVEGPGDSFKFSKSPSSGSIPRYQERPGCRLLRFACSGIEGTDCFPDACENALRPNRGRTDGAAAAITPKVASRLDYRYKD